LCADDRYLNYLVTPRGLDLREFGDEIIKSKFSFDPSRIIAHYTSLQYYNNYCQMSPPPPPPPKQPLPPNKASYRPYNNIKLLGTMKANRRRSWAQIVLYVHTCVCVYICARVCVLWESMDNFLKGVWLRLLNRETH